MSEAACTVAAYSRSNPSPRYRELIKQYRQMHIEGEKFLNIPPELTFPGQSLPPQAPRIKALIDRTGARTMLDYGAGKGTQYQPFGVQKPAGLEAFPDIKSYWGVERIMTYDPCFIPFSLLPEGKFDGVISTDVLEHCPEEDLPWIVSEIFSYATKFVFANVACFPAKKRLPNGENAHCTIKDVSWWQALFAEVTPNYPGILYDIRLAYLKSSGDGQQMVEEIISNT